MLPCSLERYRVLAVAACCCLVSASIARASDSATSAVLVERWAKGLALLHASRTDESLEWFLARKSERPDDICGFYFPALIYTNFEVGELAAEVAIERGRDLLEQGIKGAQDRVDSETADPGTRYCAGALYGLRAEDRLRRSKYLGAAFDAKRARRIMLDLLDDEPNCVDCRFWVGSYDYFADVLPGVIKFFRTLLFFPRGDKQRGLTTLGDVAARGSIDRYNAMWMLYSLYNGLEKRPDQAEKMLERIRGTYPDCADAWLTLAWHHIAKQTPPDRPRGIELHRKALERFDASPGEPRWRITERVKVSLAEAYLNDLRPREAVELLEPVLAAVRGHEQREVAVSLHMARALNLAGQHERAVHLYQGFRSRHPDSPGLEKLEATVMEFDAESSRVFHEVSAVWRIGRDDLPRAESAFVELLRRYDGLGLVHFAMACMYLDVGRHEQAEARYRAAVEAGVDRPTVAVPLSHLRIGNLLDLRGERRDARSHYRMASRTAGEHEGMRNLSRHYLKEPYNGTRGLRFP